MTQPGTHRHRLLATRPRRQEYRGYLEYLRHLGYLAAEVEELELEELQGVHGLRALRVTVALRDSLDGRPSAAAEAARATR